MEILIGLGVFLLIVLVVLQRDILIKRIFKPQQKKTARRLRAFSLSGSRGEPLDIVKKLTLSKIPWLNKLLFTASFIPRLERLRSQSAVTQPLGYFMIFSALLLVAGFFMTSALGLPLVMALPSTLLASVPFLYLLRKRKKRMEKFERQLPDALELFSQALRAGQSFPAALRIVADEFADPLGGEFGKTVDEINFGLAVPDALTNLTQRVDCDDLKFLAVSVIVQRETGGNLAEILELLSRLMRERFNFQGRVRILTAEGRMSATTLVIMPFVVVGILSMLNPDYMRVLFTDPLGRYLIAMALTMMGIGSWLIKKLVAVKA